MARSLFSFLISDILPCKFYPLWAPQKLSPQLRETIGLFFGSPTLWSSLETLQAVFWGNYSCPPSPLSGITEYIVYWTVFENSWVIVFVRLSSYGKVVLMAVWSSIEVVKVSHIRVLIPQRQCYRYTVVISGSWVEGRKILRLYELV